MSLQEILLTALMVILSAAALWKWSKALLIIINLEALSALMMLLILSSGLSIMFVVFMFFVVSEALISLSALYGTMRLVGTSYSSILMW